MWCVLKATCSMPVPKELICRPCQQAPEDNQDSQDAAQMQAPGMESSRLSGLSPVVLLAVLRAVVLCVVLGPLVDLLRCHGGRLLSRPRSTLCCPCCRLIRCTSCSFSSPCQLLLLLLLLLLWQLLRHRLVLCSRRRVGDAAHCRCGSFQPMRSTWVLTRRCGCVGSVPCWHGTCQAHTTHKFGLQGAAQCVGHHTHCNSQRVLSIHSLTLTQLYCGSTSI